MKPIKCQQGHAGLLLAECSKARSEVRSHFAFPHLIQRERNQENGEDQRLEISSEGSTMLVIVKS